VIIKNNNYRIFGRSKSRTSKKINLEKYYSLVNKYKIKKINMQNKLILDIGSGYGETSIYYAINHKDHNIISIDKYINGNLNLLKKMENLKLNNIFLYTGNVIEFLDKYKNNIYFNKVSIFFPDPWPKKKHIKRRLINENFLNNIYQYLTDNAEIYIATDSKTYSVQIMNCMYSLKDKYNWINSRNMYLDIKDYFDVETKFYRKAIDFGRIPSLFILKKI